jgi:hypothetical protein
MSQNSGASVAAGEIVVHRDDVDALPLERVEVGGERRHQRLALAGAHFRDRAAVKDNAAYHLDVVVPLPESALGGFADGGEGFGEDVVEALAVGEALAEDDRLVPKLLVGHCRNGVLEAVDPVDDLLEGADVAIVRRSENCLGKTANHARSCRLLKRADPPRQCRSPPHFSRGRM